MAAVYSSPFHLPTLHYVSQGTSIQEHLEHIERLCKAACPWVQLRLKGVSDQAYQEAAQQALDICKAHGTLLTINDNWKVALAVQADGVHVGQTDQAPALVRAAYPKAIIGATANTWEQVAALATAPIDYIGLGPLRFTTTKKKLSPILGVEGYQFIFEQMKAKGINIPVLAIGGVLEEDVAVLKKIGAWGGAVSGLLTQSNEPEELIRRLLE